MGYFANPARDAALSFSVAIARLPTTWRTRQGCRCRLLESAAWAGNLAPTWGRMGLMVSGARRIGPGPLATQKQTTIAKPPGEGCVQANTTSLSEGGNPMSDG